MSHTAEEQFAEVECAVCGRDGGPVQECYICHGNAEVQSRAHRLSEERRGAVKDPKRYGPGGEVGPKVINLPGSSNPYGLPTAN